MIKLRTVGGQDIYINELYVESIEATSNSDTTVKIHDGTTFVTEESPEELLALMVAWQKQFSRGESGEHDTGQLSNEDVTEKVSGCA